MIEYREPAADDGKGRLVGCCLTDRQGDGLSMIYSFFDAGHPMREGLGTYIIADHIQRAAGAGLPYVYLGYWIEGSARMAYKARFRSEEHTSELQSLMRISYAVFCLKKKTKNDNM